MAVNKKAIEYQVGKVIEFTCTAEVIVGDVVPIGTLMVGIAVNSGLVGEKITLEMEKVWTIKAKEADVISLGTPVYWDDSNNELTITAIDNTYAGVSLSSKTATAGTINVKINV